MRVIIIEALRRLKQSPQTASNNVILMTWVGVIELVNEFSETAEHIVIYLRKVPLQE